MQSWPNIEIVVVNDGSTDNSADIIRNLQRNNLIFLNRPNRGAAASRNDAFAASSGDFIQWLDADDLISPNKLSAQMARLLENRNCIASSSWGRFQGAPEYTRFVPDATWEDLAPLDWLERSRLGGHRMMFPALWLIPRPIAIQAGPWNESLTLADDTEYFTRLVLHADCVLFCKDALAYYRSSVPGSLSARKSRVAWTSAYEVLVLCDNHILARENSPRMRKASSIAWQDFAYSVYPHDQALGEHALDMAKLRAPDAIKPPTGSLKFRFASTLLGWRTAIKIRSRG